MKDRKKSSDEEPIALGGARTPLAAIDQIARGVRSVVIAPEAIAKMDASRRMLERHVKEGAHIYGVNTGYGASVKNRVSEPHDLSVNLMRFHGCGTGQVLTPNESAAVLATRLCSLVRGCSGIRSEVAVRLCTYINERILPVIPSEGSVGASGDLTPLSYVAATLMGEREMYAPDGVIDSAEHVLATHELSPIRLQAKESLALMNGTSVATALSVLALFRAKRVARLAARTTALVSRAVCGNPEHFADLTHQRKGHPGQILAARWVREEFESLPPTKTARLQDRYSIRCMPQIVGVLVDALTFTETILEIEVNAVTDNPIIDVEHDQILHGGNFYGGHVAFAMDGLKTAVANVADLLDRQVILLCQSEETADLAENLVGVQGSAKSSHHGFKAMSIAASALSAEALKQSLPMSVFSRSTESHNQDKVPMATIAARDALRVVELTERVLAIALLASCQAMELRGEMDHLDGAGALHAQVRSHVPFLAEDRRMDQDIQAIVSLFERGFFGVEESGEGTRERH